jgi:predicted nucleic acid-binding protein
LGISITGTSGVLAILFKDGKLTLEADALLERMIAVGFLSPVTSIKDVIRSE